MYISSLVQGAWSGIRQQLSKDHFLLKKRISSSKSNSQEVDQRGGTIPSDYIKQLLNKRPICWGVNDKPDTSLNGFSGFSTKD